MPARQSVSLWAKLASEHGTLLPLQGRLPPMCVREPRTLPRQLVSQSLGHTLWVLAAVAAGGLWWAWFGCFCAAAGGLAKSKKALAGGIAHLVGGCPFRASLSLKGRLCHQHIHTYIPWDHRTKKHK